MPAELIVEPFALGESPSESAARAEALVAWMERSEREPCQNSR